MPESNVAGKVPIIVGVTGHRELRVQDLESLKEAVRGQLESLCVKCPHSGIAVMTSLAEGADQLCAETALEMGIDVITVLPMPLEEYKSDFDGEPLVKLCELTDRAKSVTVAPQKEPYREGKAYLYRQAGIYIAEHCHVLLALWDSAPDEGPGCGTASIVQVKLNNIANGSAGEQLKRADGTVIQITAPRSGSGIESTEAGRIIMHGDVNACDTILKDTDNYNKDCGQLNEAGEADDKLTAVYTASDRLSINNDIWERRTLIGLSVCATALTFAFLLYDEAEWHGMILVCGFMIIALFAINAFTKWTRFNEKYVEYRILAELCRVQTYLRDAGISRSVTEIMPWNLQVTVPWVKGAVSAIMTGIKAGEKKSILDSWIIDQKEYHKKALKRTEAQLKRNDWIVGVALVITILSYVFALLFEVICGGMITGSSMFTPEINNAVRTGIKLCMGTFSAVTLFANNYYGRLALPNVIDDHRKMALLYEEAEREIADKGEAEALLLRIAEDELCENANWYAYRSKNDAGLGI